jgi:hypothetical protein
MSRPGCWKVSLEQTHVLKGEEGPWFSLFLYFLPLLLGFLGEGGEMNVGS